MPCTEEDKTLMENLLFPEQDSRYIDVITRILNKSMVYKSAPS